MGARAFYTFSGEIASFILQNGYFFVKKVELGVEKATEGVRKKPLGGMKDRRARLSG